MEELRKLFLTDSISLLEDFQNKLRNNSFSDEIQHNLFRFLHTVKGTSQTFGLIAAAKTAHETENILQNSGDAKFDKADTKLLLIKGLQILNENLCGRIPASSEDFFAEIENRFPHSSRAEISFVNLAEFISNEHLNKLSSHEKKSLTTAIESGKKLFAAETYFETANFTEGISKLLKNLTDEGEIIATFPMPNEIGKTGFCHFFVTRKDKNYLAEKLKIFNSKITERNEVNFTNNIEGIFAQAAVVTEQVAKIRDKKVCLETFTETSEFSTEHLRLFSDIFLHLIRNSIDHGIEQAGKIKIEISSKNEEIILRFSDNGRGIDKEKLRVAAIEKKLMSAEKILPDEAIFDLIFTHGLSTSQEVSEISGRGIGLDAVKDAVEKIGGEISVESEKKKGTTFEIVLRKNEKGLQK